MAEQIILNIENDSIIPSLRKVLSLIEGVSIVKKPKTKNRSKKKKLTPYEQAMDDLCNGRVTTYDNAEDFFKEIGI